MPLDLHAPSDRVYLSVCGWGRGECLKNITVILALGCLSCELSLYGYFLGSLGARFYPINTRLAFGLKRRGAGEAEGEGGGWVQNCAPRSIVFSSRFARARVSLSFESTLPCSGRRCVRANAFLLSVGAQRRVPALPVRGLFFGGGGRRIVQRRVRYFCFWRALDQSA